MVQVGEALAKLHRHSSSAAGGSSFSDEDNLRQLAEHIVSLNPALADQARTLTQTLIDRLHAEQHVVTTIHGDFYAKQVLLNDDGVSFIDFDESRTGTAWVDVGNFVAKLIWSGLRDELPQQYVTDCRQHFLDGYHRTCRRSDAAALSTHIAIGLLHCVPHPFRRGFSDWPRMMEALVDAAWNELQPSCPSLVRVPDDVDDAMPMLRAALDPAVMQAELHTAGIITEDQQVRAARVMKHKRGRRCLIGSEPVTSHWDLFPDQVLVDGGRLWLLDFDLYCHAPRSLDAGNFIAHIIEQSIRQPEHRESLRQFASEFRNSWVAATSDATALHCFTVLSLARHIQLSTLDPARREFAAAILEAVEDAANPTNSCRGDFAAVRAGGEYW